MTTIRYPEQSRPAGIGDSLQRAWDALKPNIWLFAGFTILYYIASALITQVAVIIPGFNLLSGLFGFILPVSLYSAFQVADGGAEVRFSDFFNWTPKFGRLLIGTLIIYAMVLALLIPAGLLFGFSFFAGASDYRLMAGLGFGLFGLFFLIFLVFFVFTFAFYFLLLKQDMGVGETLSASLRFGSKYFGPILLWLLLAMGLIIAGALACGLGLLVTVPLIVGTQYFFMASIFPDAKQAVWDFEQTPGPDQPYNNY